MHSASPHHPHHLRFYIVLVTVVVGVIFVLLFLNNDGEKFSITNAVIGSSNNTDNLESEDVENPSGAVVATKRANNREIEASVTINQIPVVDELVKASTIILDVNDLATAHLNGDRLELNSRANGSNDIQFVIEDFEGKFAFDDETLSLDGTGSKIEVNGISLSALKELEISLDGTDYLRILADDISLKNVVVKGDGVFTAGRLSVDMLEEEIQFKDFTGELEVDRMAESTFVMGVSDNIIFGGELFDFSLD